MWFLIWSNFSGFYCLLFFLFLVSLRLSFGVLSSWWCHAASRVFVVSERLRHIEHGSVSSFTYNTTSCRSAPCHWRRWDAAFVMLVHSSLGCVDAFVFRTTPDNAINYNTILSVTSLLRHHRYCQCWSAVKNHMCMTHALVFFVCLKMFGQISIERSRDYMTL